MGFKYLKDIGRNPSRTMTLLVRCWTSFLFSRIEILKILSNWLGFTLTPPFVTMKLRNWQEPTPNEHFTEFSFILYFLQISKASPRCLICCSAERDFISISWTYTSIFYRFIPRIFYSLDVAPAFLSPNDMTLLQWVPHLAMKAAFS